MTLKNALRKAVDTYDLRLLGKAIDLARDRYSITYQDCYSLVADLVEESTFDGMLYEVDQLDSGEYSYAI